MKKWLVVILIAVSVGSVYAAEEMKGELKGFSFEIPNKDGSRYALIKGSGATTIPGGMVEILDIVTKIFCADGREVVITSDKGMFNRNNAEVTTDSPVKITSSDIFVSGNGLSWNPNNRLIEINENVKVEVNLKRKGLKE